jgi:hypothetical protein
MNRRGFLGSLAGFAAALTLEPEKALWVPGQKLISIPKPMPVLSVDDYQRLYIDVLDRMYLGYYNEYPKRRRR